MNKETGGAAFPFIDSASPLEHSGMTLRDYFAAKAMQGLLAGLLANGMDVEFQSIAINAYHQADPMLKARK